jgi:hypothetical protein
MDPDSTNNRYFTLMPNVPLAINREEALSLLASVSSVKSLHLLHIYHYGCFMQRVGLVEVADKESVFRLTSRQFLLRGSHAVKHRMIASDSFLATEFGDLDLFIHLNFYSRNHTAMTRVIDFFEQFGSLNIMSMKSKEGFHELTLRAAKDYSIRHHSTDLRLKVDEILVELQFPEEKLNYDYVAQDPSLQRALELSSVVHSHSKPFVPSSYFFDPTPTNCLNDQLSVTVAVADRHYVFDLEDDDLSVSAYEEDSCEAKYHGQSTSIESWQANSHLEHFSQQETRAFIVEHPLAPETAQRKACWSQGAVAGRESVAHPCGSHKRASKQTATQSLSGSEHPAPTECQAKKSKPARKKKAQKDKMLKSDVRKVDKGQRSTKKGETNHSNDQLIDGKTLLDLIWSPPVDYSEVNSLVMPEIHAKWRRFVEIKDEMRRLKYVEYLMAKRKDCEDAETDSNNLSKLAEL